MSRPPRPLFRRSTTGDGAAFAAHRQFLPIEFAEMVALERALAQSEARLGVTEEEGDFAHTLMELSALVAQTLGLYQNLYAREAYLGTAATARSLVLHARRLAYEPDQGLAASGYAILTIGLGLAGKLPAGFALASSPRGEVKAQTFETLKALAVDARRNEALPVHRTRPAHLSFSGRRASFRLAGTGLNLIAGERGILMRESDNTWVPVTIIVLSEAGAETTVEVELMAASSQLAGTPQALAAADGSPAFRLLAMPRARMERFGCNADPVQFPPDKLNTASGYPSAPVGAPNPDFGYSVTLDTGSTAIEMTDIYLHASLKPDLVSQLVIARVSGTFQAVKVVAQGAASVAFRRGQAITYKELELVVTSGTPTTQNVSQVLETSLTGTVAYLQLQNSGGAPINRSAVALQTPLWGDWVFEAPILAHEPNPSSLSAPLELDADFGDFRPGDLAVFGALDGSFHQVIEVQSLTPDASITTLDSWEERTPAPLGGWTLDNLRVFGNVARVTHGETMEEVLGGSDGVTPFQRFELKKAPLTQVPGADGGEPAIVVRVNEVAWTRVEDFYHSGSEDRHYRLEADENQQISVIFGNGRNGAIPPSGRKHIRATYRQGLGVAGNVATGQASRIKKAHPLIERAANPAPIVGGADPAGLQDLQRQATRFIRTFDRAVSLRDHADVALLYPGVARAAARFAGAGIEVIVANARGDAPVQGDVEKYLNARRDTTLPMTVKGAAVVDLFLTLNLRHDPAYLTETVKLAVRDALVEADQGVPGMFTFAARDFGQAAHLSEVYNRVAAVPGVSFVDVTAFHIAEAASVKDVLRVDAHQWLRLPPENLSLSLAPEV